MHRVVLKLQKKIFFFSGANFLYLNFFQEGMQLAEKTCLDNGLRSVRFVVEQKFNWNPAFKMQLGLNLKSDQWCLFTEYFYFFTADTTTSSASLYNNEYFNMSTLFGSSINNADYVLDGVYLNSHWKIQGNFLDLNLARVFYNAKKILLTPVLGLRAAWLYQKLNGYWMDSSYSLDLPSSIRSASFGIGPKFSLNSRWLLGKGFSLVGNVTTAALHTHYRLKKNTHAYVNAYFPVPVYKVHNTRNFLRPYLETETGINWGSYFQGKAWHMSVNLTYVFNIYFRQNLISNYYNQLRNTSSGDLYMQGLNLQLLFDF